MAPAGQYVFAEMLGISEHFTAGSHEWLPYSVIPTFSKLICKHQLPVRAAFARSEPRNITPGKIVLEFSKKVCYNTLTVQGSYIGNTTASQARVALD